MADTSAQRVLRRIRNAMAATSIREAPTNMPVSALWLSPTTNRGPFVTVFTPLGDRSKVMLLCSLPAITGRMQEISAKMGATIGKGVEDFLYLTSPRRDATVLMIEPTTARAMRAATMIRAVSMM